jgi:hypothetical protein
MWNLFNCYMSGRHDYGMWCEPGAIFLRCVHCGTRSSGWAIEAKLQTVAPRAAGATTSTAPPARVIPFDRAAES